MLGIVARRDDPSHCTGLEIRSSSAFAGAQPLGMLLPPRFGESCCKSLPQQVGSITMLSAVLIPVTRSSMVSTPEGAYTLRNRIDEAEFLLALDEGWSARVSGMVMHLESKHASRGKSAASIVPPMRVLDAGAGAPSVSSWEPTIIDGSSGDGDDCARSFEWAIEDCDVVYARDVAAADGGWREALIGCTDAWDMIEDAATAAAAAGGLLGGCTLNPGVVLMCGGGGAIIGTIWDLADCISDANTKHVRDLAAARQRRNDCCDDAGRNFERCLQAGGLVPVSWR